ncbi:hypothetical protein FACS1894111_07580 [Clostridia bacterium]|nr:hypothetical protein FACS1894111_07580 [Clostridia bacterium]
MKKRILTVTALSTLLLLTACSAPKGLDVVGQESISAFDKVLTAIPDKVNAEKSNDAWSITSPDQEVRFIWSADYSTSPLYDVMLELDARPFLEAGLDPEKLPDNYYFTQSNAQDVDTTDGTTNNTTTNSNDGGTLDNGGTYDTNPRLIVGTKLGTDTPDDKDDSSPLTAYKQIVNHYRDSINYHNTLDHYGVKLGDGNMFEWAKDMSTNEYDKSVQDKDIVYVLNPEPLIAAGVDPEKVTGWAYAQVPIEENGKPVQVFKFLKAFDLK